VELPPGPRGLRAVYPAVAPGASEPH
jgi:hypothetical protein